MMRINGGGLAATIVLLLLCLLWWAGYTFVLVSPNPDPHPNPNQVGGLHLRAAQARRGRGGEQGQAHRRAARDAQARARPHLLPREAAPPPGAPLVHRPAVGLAAVLPQRGGALLGPRRPRVGRRCQVGV